jgi:hypothetical protein
LLHPALPSELIEFTGIGTTKTEKQTSYKVLLILILSLFVSQTIHAVYYWYFIWLAFIQNGSTSDQTMTVMTASPALGSSLLAVFGVMDFMLTVSIGIADSILVSALFLHCGVCIYMFGRSRDAGSSARGAGKRSSSRSYAPLDTLVR